MSHDATKVLLGTTHSSWKRGTEDFVGSNPDTFVAGLAVRRTSANAISVAKSAGEFVGISVGRSLSDWKNTTVLKAGLSVPIQVEATPARGVVTITSYANLVATGNDTIKVGATTFTFKTSPSTEAEVLCAASGSTNAVVAAALAAKINAHSVAGTLFIASVVGAVVTITAKNNATLGASIDLVYTDNGSSTVGATADHATFTGGGTTTDFIVKGAPVYISDTTGKADDKNSESTITNAIYRSGLLTGVMEDGTTVACAIVDMAGGL